VSVGSPTRCRAVRFGFRRTGRAPLFIIPLAESPCPFHGQEVMPTAQNTSAALSRFGRQVVATSSALACSPSRQVKARGPQTQLDALGAPCRFAVRASGLRPSPRRRSRTVALNEEQTESRKDACTTNKTTRGTSIMTEVSDKNKRRSMREMRTAVSARIRSKPTIEGQRYLDL